MQALEDFGDSEPKECLVIYTNEDGDLCWSCSSDQMTTKIGLLETCKQYMLAQVYKQ